MINLKSKKPIIIAGPCAAESHQQVIGVAKRLKKIGVDGIRASLWKPRTQPGFQGVGARGAPWLTEVSKIGLTIATEVMLPEHVTAIASHVLKQNLKAQLLLWLGSRNQNHNIQKQIARRILSTCLANTILMIKNQPWEDSKHWLGILEHVLQTGFPKDRILMCHRGFCPNGKENPFNFRNLPNFQMAMRVKEQTDCPMILDPSHIGGSRENVIRVIKESLVHRFDGFMIETHQNPTKALTDVNQQLTINQLCQVLKLIRRKENQ